MLDKVCESVTTSSCGQNLWLNNMGGVDSSIFLLVLTRM